MICYYFNATKARWKKGIPFCGTAKPCHRIYVNLSGHISHVKDYFCIFNNYFRITWRNVYKFPIIYAAWDVCAKKVPEISYRLYEIPSTFYVLENCFNWFEFVTSWIMRRIRFLIAYDTFRFLTETKSAKILRCKISHTFLRYASGGVVQTAIEAYYSRVFPFFSTCIETLTKTCYHVICS